MADKGLLINYRWCSGCHSCEVACQMENDLLPGEFGIKISQVGPWQYGEKQWVYDFIPSLTDQCKHCAENVPSGEVPACEQHCQAHCIKFVSPEEAMSEISQKNKVMFIMP